MDNPAVDLRNSSIISIDEQAYINPPAPGVAIAPDPIFPLTRDYLKNIVFADNNTLSQTADLCEYSCDSGYRVSNTTCPAVNNNTQAITCTVAPTVTISAPR